MVGPIGTTMDALCRHGMVINVTCRQCGRVAELAARLVRTEKNRGEDFRRLRYRCECGCRQVKAYAFPADWGK